MVHIVEHGTWTLRDEDEFLHPLGAGVLWNESYYFDFAVPGRSLGGYVRLGLYPNWNRAWYWACVAGAGRPLVLVADNVAPLPARDGTDVRAGSYTATQTVSRPFGPVRVRLDAAAAAVLPDSTAALGDLDSAETTRLVLDLEFRTAGGVYPYKDVPRYEIPCQVSGTVRVGTETFAVTGHGERDHSWGERDWWTLSWLWSAGRFADGTAFHGAQPNLPFRMERPAFIVPPGETVEHLDGFSTATRFGADGLPVSSRMMLRDVATTVTPVAFAPVAVVSPDGRIGRFARALCRFTADDGRTGYGWTEWNQPPGWRDHDWSPDDRTTTSAGRP